ncbi:MAG: hypothetical protein LH478_10285 [Chitinophagaceae bacterium]|nr:hypothetical protein [Chitinophagaceae bacterium]
MHKSATQVKLHSSNVDWFKKSNSGFYPLHSIIAQHCRFPWLTQKELQVPLPALKPMKENLQGRHVTALNPYLLVKNTNKSEG